MVSIHLHSCKKDEWVNFRSIVVKENMVLTSKWHFSRERLADSYIDQLKAGFNNIVIFAERRKGKTEFLVEDLTPVAQKLGFRTVYINFWEQKSHPVHCIAKGVERSLAKVNKQFLKSWQKDINIKVPGLAHKTETNSQKSEVLAYESLELLLQPKGEVLLMFDEVQHLATDEKFEKLIATIRTFLDSNKNRVRAVFTGSSQSRLNLIFRHQKSAFYRGASLVEFPDMDERFVCHLLTVYKAITTKSLDEAKAISIFAQFHYSPFLMVDLMQTMMRENIVDFDDGLNYYHQTNNPNQQWQALYNELKLIDQLVLTQVVVREKALYHDDTYQLIGELLGIDEVTRGMIQASINRLKELGIVNSVARGVWEIESAEFRHFLCDEL